MGKRKQRLKEVVQRESSTKKKKRESPLERNFAKIWVLVPKAGLLENSKWLGKKGKKVWSNAKRQMGKKQKLSVR